jgi:hypothetical protein
VGDPVRAHILTVRVGTWLFRVTSRGKTVLLEEEGWAGFLYTRQWEATE